MSSFRAPLLPLRDLVLFPGTATVLFIGRPQSLGAVRRSLSEQAPLFVVAQRDPSADPSAETLFGTGTLGYVRQTVTTPEGTLKILLELTGRAKLLALTAREDHQEAEVAPFSLETAPETEALLAGRRRLVRFLRWADALDPERAERLEQLPLEAFLQEAAIPALLKSDLATRVAVLEARDVSRLEALLLAEMEKALAAEGAAPDWEQWVARREEAVGKLVEAQRQKQPTGVLVLDPGTAQRQGVPARELALVEVCEGPEAAEALALTRPGRSWIVDLATGGRREIDTRE